MHRHGHRSRSVPKTEEGKRKTPDPISQVNQGFVFGCVSMIRTYDLRVMRANFHHHPHHHRITRH